jgi:hypothetical protein
MQKTRTIIHNNVKGSSMLFASVQLSGAPSCIEQAEYLNVLLRGDWRQGSTKRGKLMQLCGTNLPLRLRCRAIERNLRTVFVK